MASKNFSQIEGLYDQEAEVPPAARAAALVDLGPEASEITPAQEDHLLPADPFDYNVLNLTDDDRFVLKGCRQRIIGVLGEAFLSAGRDLLVAKQLIQDNSPRGTWTKWLKNSLCVSESTARNWMDSASWAAICPTVGEMAPGAMYLGAAAPAEVQDEIVKRLESGELVKATDIKRMIKAHRAAGSETITGEAVDGSAVDNSQADTASENDVPTAEQLETENAARELLARLREQFDDHSITELLALFDQTSVDAVRKVLKEARLPISE